MIGRRLFSALDLPTILAALALAGIGLLSIASATLEQPGRAGLWKMQLAWLVVAIVAAAVVVAVDYRLWAALALVLHGVALGLLACVLAFGREVGGNRSWLELGPLRAQPSELAKWTTCLVLAVYLARRVRSSMGLRQLGEMSLLVAAPLGLIALQPDMGTALIFVPIFGTALMIGGVRWKILVGFAVLALLLAPIGWNHLKPYQKARILTMFDAERDPSGVGYQVRQSKIAIGSGGLVGKGLFAGTQGQLNFLPAQHTDFVLSTFTEETGFLGAVGVLGLFYFVMWRGIVAARSAQDRLGSSLCMLVVAWITGQMAINVGMILGRLPTIGVPLPFLSYGGSALVASMCGVALVVNVRTRRFVN
jgi:rod shape determining protein RodA